MSLDDIFAKLEKKSSPKKRASRKASPRKTIPKDRQKPLPYTDNKPEHFDAKFGTNENHTLVSSVAYISKDGEILVESILRTDLNTYVLRTRNVDYDLIREIPFSTLEQAQKESNLKEVLTEEDNPLVKSIKDLITRINNIDNELFYFLKLMINPSLREEMEIQTTNHIVDRVSYSVQEQLKGENPTDKSTYIRYAAKHIIEKIRNHHNV